MNIGNNDIGKHPGEILKRHFLDRYGITQVELADHLCISFQRVNEIVNGKRGITPDTAMLLAQAFRTNADFWIWLQGAYDLRSYDEPVRTIKPMIKEK